MKANKATKIVSALGLSCALALGTAIPAFAATEDAGVQAVKDEAQPYSEEKTAKIEEDQIIYNHEQGGSVDTEVKVATIITNINVAVPLQITIVADSAGGDVYAPSAGLKRFSSETGGYDSTTGYRIENYSTYPVEISGVKAVEKEAGLWKLVPTINNANVQGKIGDLNLTLTPSDNEDKPLIKNEGNQNATNTPVALHTTTGEAAAATPGWIVDKVADAEGAKAVADRMPAIMGLELKGESSVLRNVNQNSVLTGDKDADLTGVTPDEAFSIVYTVKAHTTSDTAATN